MAVSNVFIRFSILFLEIANVFYRIHCQSNFQEHRINCDKITKKNVEAPGNWHVPNKYIQQEI